ncbi:hypothetical protein AN3590.2 [Aspergillus nidulans FGSC A4]|uniref:Uncharacterized protein n=1 Tax=Emericella nidulans (strain FGSC A4 / ATCC 38163 / CBS 112.46 / NRRL 194 / M139) TaxID=227321 RepID=Q5B790_EMENI|nr:hypothetical protein [Aspergillus nidulans FGSC A4]EAA59798.1 hypothetical protein AN3590.2 [Aspergillus nidulans FGSC A4]CBF75823.1 TPA: conserved hypothetical protein [Aspergillus nidulans FGSC A4]|eukprot:XP_661194.1 hypothetical protein AN3590.2 [Aspergillus nidulans FGSC A4]
MATPTDITFENYNGSWTMDRTISDPTDPILAMQGLSWFMRTTLAWVTITLNTKQYQDAEHPDDKTIQHIDVDNIVTGGVQGTSEARVTDWKKREHSDTIFGRVEGQSRLIRGSAKDGKVRPDVDVCTRIQDEKIGRFLRGEIGADGSETEGFLVDPAGEGFGEGEGLWLQSWVESVDSTWTAEQIWGFETINGQRYHTRRVVCANNGEYVLARLVYTFVPPRNEDEDIAY